MIGQVGLLFACFTTVCYALYWNPTSQGGCPPNQVFTNNYMPDCEPSCDQPNHYSCFYISNQVGCTCQQGYYRTRQGSQGSCVSMDQCYNQPAPYPTDLSSICPPICYAYNPYSSGYNYPALSTPGNSGPLLSLRPRKH